MLTATVTIELSESSVEEVASALGETVDDVMAMVTDYIEDQDHLEDILEAIWEFRAERNVTAPLD